MTDTLVERLLARRVANAGVGEMFIPDDLCVEAASRIAEKDDALRKVRDWRKNHGITEHYAKIEKREFELIERICDKALSHSSDGGNNAV
jgi:hypothetical protein